MVSTAEGAEGGAAGAAAGGKKAAKEVDTRSSLPTVAAVLAFVLLSLGGVGAFVYYRQLQREEYLRVSERNELLIEVSEDYLRVSDVTSLVLRCSMESLAS